MTHFIQKIATSQALVGATPPGIIYPHGLPYGDPYRAASIGYPASGHPSYPAGLGKTFIMLTINLDLI